jgi:hypothetical protein
MQNAKEVHAIRISGIDAANLQALRASFPELEKSPTLKARKRRQATIENSAQLCS